MNNQSLLKNCLINLLIMRGSSNKKIFLHNLPRMLTPFDGALTMVTISRGGVRDLIIDLIGIIGINTFSQPETRPDPLPHNPSTSVQPELTSTSSQIQSENSSNPTHPRVTRSNLGILKPIKLRYIEAKIFFLSCV